jgi:hypothetical protein
MRWGILCRTKFPCGFSMREGIIHGEREPDFLILFKNDHKLNNKKFF